MPQLDSFFFWGESIVTLVLLYTMIYFYLFWFSKQNFEYWLVSSRVNYYFEKLFIFVFYNHVVVNQKLYATVVNFCTHLNLANEWEDVLHSLNAIE